MTAAYTQLHERGARPHRPQLLARSHCRRRLEGQGSPGKGSLEWKNPHAHTKGVERYKKATKQRKLNDLYDMKRRIRAAAYRMGGADIRRFFGALDRDNNGEINLTEWLRGARTRGLVVEGRRQLDDHHLEVFPPQHCAYGMQLDDDEYQSTVQG